MRSVVRTLAFQPPLSCSRSVMAVHALDLRAERGDVVQIVLVQTEALDHFSRDREKYAVTSVKEIQPPKKLAFHCNAPP